MLKYIMLLKVEQVKRFNKTKWEKINKRYSYLSLTQNSKSLHFIQKMHFNQNNCFYLKNKKRKKVEKKTFFLQGFN